MRRGDLVVVAVSGDFGKPRPAVIIQSDLFSATATLTVALLTTAGVEAPFVRLSILPSTENGLSAASQIMIDKVMTLRREKIGKIIGKVDRAFMADVDRALAVFLGLA